MNQVLKPLDFEMAQLVHQEINANCVNLILEDGVDHFQKQGTEVVLESGRVLAADLVILAIGVVPENGLAKSANLKCGPRGHVVTTDNYETMSAENDLVNPDVFAIGEYGKFRARAESDDLPRHLWNHNLPPRRKPGQFKVHSWPPVIR